MELLAIFLIFILPIWFILDLVTFFTLLIWSLESSSYDSWPEKMSDDHLPTLVFLVIFSPILIAMGIYKGIWPFTKGLIKGTGRAFRELPASFESKRDI